MRMIRTRLQMPAKSNAIASFESTLAPRGCPVGAGNIWTIFGPAHHQLYPIADLPKSLAVFDFLITGRKAPLCDLLTVYLIALVDAVLDRHLVTRLLTPVTKQRRKERTHLAQ